MIASESASARVRSIVVFNGPGRGLLKRRWSKKLIRGAGSCTAAAAASGASGASTSKEVASTAGRGTEELEPFEKDDAFYASRHNLIGADAGRVEVFNAFISG